MNTNPLITVFDFVDNNERWSLISKKADEKWLSPKEKSGTLLTLSDSLTSNISIIQGLKDKIRFNVVNILDYQNVPNEIPWDAFIFWGFPNIWNVSEDFVNGLKSIVIDIVDVRRKPFLGMCFWHQLLAQSYWWELALMDKRIIWADEITLNNEWMRDSLFSQLNTQSFGSIWWHKRRVASVWNDTKVLWSNNKWEFQVIKVWDNARWIQWHPDFTTDWTIGLVKLWKNWITKEWNNSDDIISWLRTEWFNNDSSRIIWSFVKKVVWE